MKYLIQILLIFSFNTSFAQTKENSGLLELSPFNLGDSMSKFQDSILCTDGNKDRPCEMYRYLPNNNKPKIIAGVAFENMKVFIGKKQVVKNIYLLKNYNGVDSIALNNELEKDFESLVSHFKKFFAGRKFSSSKDKMNTIEWETYS